MAQPPLVLPGNPVAKKHEIGKINGTIVGVVASAAPLCYPAHGWGPFTLLQADGRVAFADVPAHTLLVTRAFGRQDGQVTAARLCEHFEGHGRCNRGARCRFAHRAAVAIAPRRKRNAAPPALRLTAVSDGSDTDTEHHDDDCSVVIVVDDARSPAAASADQLPGPFFGTTPRHDANRSTAAAVCPPPLARRLGDHPKARRITTATKDATDKSNKVWTSRGWRHAAYDATPGMEAQRAL
jgi:hypothetical protein